MPASSKDFQLTITSNAAVSTDPVFTTTDLTLGDHHHPITVKYVRSDGREIERNRAKGERKMTNRTMPRLICQVFEKELISLAPEDRLVFPICQYKENDEVIKGIFTSSEEYRAARNSAEFVEYNYGDNQKLVLYSWSIFSTLRFVQECMRRFGQEGDRVVMIYAANADALSEKSNAPTTHQNIYSDMLLESKNLIFRGAPGTGKSYLAKQIATDIISQGAFSDYTQLTPEQKQQVEFVQFHPSYDYADFVEGLRPRVNADGSMGFELQDGIFTRFVNRAQKNYDDAQKSAATIAKEASVQEQMADYFSNLELEDYTPTTARGTKFYIESVDERHINIAIPDNKVANKLSLNVDELRQMLESGQKFSQVKDLVVFFGKRNATQQYTYDLALFSDIKAQRRIRTKVAVQRVPMKPYVFIIDEINRGEISKIFGELFFAIDPGYRGIDGEVSTQYANMHENPEKKFSIPENVYIIGTMNDIDRSVDSFDFAMRRRFRFIEIKAGGRLDMLNVLGDSKKNEAIRRMSALNAAISSVDELNENYQVGAAYFLKLATVDFDQLWNDYLQPLLQEYVRGIYGEDEIMAKFAHAYGANAAVAGEIDDESENQG